MNATTRLSLVQQIQQAFANHVLDQFGRVMDEAYLLDNWTTDEGFLINGITRNGLIYDVEAESRTLYEWDLLGNSTLDDVLVHLNEESFA